MPQSDETPSNESGSRRRSKKSLVPDRFTLAGTVWKVKFCEDLGGELGRCERDKALIRLLSGMSEQVTLSTFCHELFHAIRFTQGVTDHDERDIDALGHLLHQFLVTRN